MTWIKEVRKEKQMTGEDVSQKAWAFLFSTTILSRTENAAPSVGVAKRIASVLGFDWTRFFEDGEKPGESVTVVFTGKRSEEEGPKGGRGSEG